MERKLPSASGFGTPKKVGGLALPYSGKLLRPQDLQWQPIAAMLPGGGSILIKQRTFTIQVERPPDIELAEEVSCYVGCVSKNSRLLLSSVEWCPEYLLYTFTERHPDSLSFNHMMTPDGKVENEVYPKLLG